MGSLYCWSIAALLHGASPKAPVVPRTPSLLINGFWTGLAMNSPMVPKPGNQKKW